MSKPKNQHIIPRVYLKQFQVNDGSFVYCYQLSHKYKNCVEKIGVNDNRFKITNFYTDNELTDKYAIERFFSTHIEAPWPTVIKELNNRTALSKDSKMLLIHWIYSLSYRNPLSRNHYKKMVKFVYETTAKMRNETIDDYALEEHAKYWAKEMQLQSFTNPKTFKERYEMFEKGLVNKTWRILEAPEEYFFITNDKPIYSPNLHPLAQKYSPFHFNAEINWQSQIYFVLTPRFCLELTPFIKGTPLDANLWNMRPIYEVITPLGVGLVNRGIICTADKYIISNSFELLEQTRYQLNKN